MISWKGLGKNLCAILAFTWVKKGKAIPVTGREGPYGCETSLYPQVDSWYSFLLEAESTPGP
jgi:hypothetical protein